MNYGYIRILNNVMDREMVVQTHVYYLQKSGAEKIYIETDGSQLENLLDILEPNDSLHVFSIGRLTRNTDRWLSLVKIFTEKNIRLYASGELVSMDPINLSIIENFMQEEEQTRKSCLKMIIHNRKKT